MSPAEMFHQLRGMYPTAAALARALTISRQALSELLKGSSSPSDQTIIKGCTLLGIPPGPTLCTAKADSATDPTTAATWTALALQLAAEPTATAPPNPEPLKNAVRIKNYAQLQPEQNGRDNHFPAKALLNHEFD